MKNINLIKSAVLAALLGAAVSAQAAGINIVAGDLVLGFQNASKSVEFNLGLNNPVIDAMDGSTHLLGNVSGGLSNSTAGGTGWGTGYGAGWASDGSIVWGTYSVDGSNFTTGMSQTGGSPLATLSGGAAVQNSTGILPGDTGSALGSLGNLLTAANSNAPSGKVGSGGVQIAATQGNGVVGSWNHIDPNLATASAFATYLHSDQLNAAVTATVQGTAGLLNGKSYSALDLYQATGAAGAVSESFLGTLALTSTGDVYFISALAAIPEPSTYAAILGVATLAFAAIRRRKQAQLAV